jgi:tRNA A37 threonylcarbamoyladenosine dehydratase
VDYDRYDITNQNRQIGSEYVGELKVEVLKRLYPKITAINRRMDIDWVRRFDFNPFDVVIDSCDTTSVKLELAKRVYKKLIMSTGSAKRWDASKIEVASIWKTHGDALARKLRNELKRANFNRNFLVLFSPEEDRCKSKGSFVAVTGAFGLTLCSEVVKKILS